MSDWQTRFKQQFPSLLANNEGKPYVNHLFNVTESVEDFIATVRAEAVREERERCREAVDKIMNEPSIWCLEELCKDRTCRTCKAGAVFQRDLKPALLAALDPEPK